MIEQGKAKSGFKRRWKDADVVWLGGMGMMLILLLLCLFMVRKEPSWGVIAMTVYGVGSLSLCVGVYFYTAYRVNEAFYGLGEMAEDLLKGKSKAVFPVSEDTILSRLQAQLFRLYDVLHSYEEREKKSREQLDENIGDLVHQLNTPVTNMKLYVGFLEREDLTKEERAEFLQCLMEQAEKLSWLGESFSKVSRLETGIIHLEPGKQKLEPMLLSAVSQIMEKAQSRKMEITLRGEAQTEVMADAKWTSEAIFNVLDNAVKYGEESSLIEIDVSKLASYVRVAVRNSGQEIRKEEYHKIFHRFYRGKEAAGQPGVGLGLSITRKILEQENGYIQAGRTTDGRTEFVMYLLAGM